MLHSEHPLVLGVWGARRAKTKAILLQLLPLFLSLHLSAVPLNPGHRVAAISVKGHTTRGSRRRRPPSLHFSLHYFNCKQATHNVSSLDTRRRGREDISHGDTHVHDNTLAPRASPPYLCSFFDVRRRVLHASATIPGDITRSTCSARATHAFVVMQDAGWWQEALACRCALSGVVCRAGCVRA